MCPAQWAARVTRTTASSRRAQVLASELMLRFLSVDRGTKILGVDRDATKLQGDGDALMLPTGRAGVTHPRPAQVERASAVGAEGIVKVGGTAPEAHGAEDAHMLPRVPRGRATARAVSPAQIERANLTVRLEGTEEIGGDAKEGLDARGTRGDGCALMLPTDEAGAPRGAGRPGRVRGWCDRSGREGRIRCCRRGRRKGERRCLQRSDG